MKVSFTRSCSSKARKIFSGLRQKLFDQDYSTGFCHSHCNEEVNSICILVQCQNFYSLIPLLDDFQWLPVSRANFYPAFLLSLLMLSLTIFGSTGI